MQRDPIQSIESDAIAASIYPVQQGYRVVINSPEFYWHPGIFPSLPQLREWLTHQFRTLELGLPLGGDWLMLEGDFDSNEIYRGWFVYDARCSWRGYDPFTNRCYRAATLKQLKAKIDQIEFERSVSLEEAS